MDKQFEPAKSVYYPQTASVYAVNAIETMKANAGRGAKFPIPGIADYFAPLQPGQICAVIAQTSQYKSGFMRFWGRAIAEELRQAGRANYGVFHVSVEECVEEQVFHELAHETGYDAGKIARGDIQDWNKLLKAAVHIGQVPIYRIGDSLARADDMPNLTMSNMIRAIQTIIDGKIPGLPAVKPAVLFFDYLQAFPFDAEIRKLGTSDQQRRLQVREDVFRLRQAAAHFDCPVVVGVQAKQTLSAQGDVKLPGIYDGEESSSIAQRMDRIVTLWMPARTKMTGDSFEYGARRLTVQENMLFVQIAKQRGGLPAGRVFPCRIDFNRNEITQDTTIGGK